MRRALAVPTLAAGALTVCALTTQPAAAGLVPAPPSAARLAGLQSATARDGALAAAVRASLSTPSVAAATVGVVVRDGIDGHVVATRNPTTPISPASTAKVRTTGAAMALLGPGFAWHTDVLARGARHGGVLDGPLVVKGFGDPTLQRADLTRLAQQVRATGITHVTGLLTDDTYFDAVRRNPTWNPANFADYYSGPVSALTMSPDTDLDIATAIVQYSPGAPGGPARVWTVPAAAASYLTIVNQATTGGSGDSVWVDQPVDSGRVTIGGRVGSGQGTASVLTVTPSPQLYVATVLKAELAAAGVTVSGGANPGRALPTDARVARDTSAPLRDVIRPLLKQSNNLVAEAMLKTISAQGGGGGTWPDGSARVRAWMTRAGIDVRGVRIVDGSGLSHANTETATSEAGTLWALRASTAVYDALPVAGISDPAVGGTLRNRMVGTAAAGNLHAKTGTIDGITALSGYVRTANGRPLIMSMLSAYTGTSPRPAENALAVSLASWPGTVRTSRLASTAPAAGADASEWTKRTR